MASPTPKRPQPDPFARYPPRPPQSGPPDLVHPMFLFKAFAGVVVAAVVLAYLSVCLLVYIGGWHRLLHPITSVVLPPPELLHVEPVTFGKPRLTGWWIPSDAATAPTLLYLHDGDGALSFGLRDLALLHTAGVNIFAIDYRGYGQSDGPHPTQARMQEDSAVALDYLLYTRHIPAGKIVPFGAGLGGVMAARLAAAHPELPGIIVDEPRPFAYFQVVDAQQSHLLPMHLLLGDTFDIGTALADVHQPKLLFAYTPEEPGPGMGESNAELFRRVPTPKVTVTFPRGPGNAQFLEALRRFLDENVK